MRARRLRRQLQRQDVHVGRHHIATMARSFVCLTCRGRAQRVYGAGGLITPVGPQA